MTLDSIPVMRHWSQQWEHKVLFLFMLMKIMNHMQEQVIQMILLLMNER